ncbi:MAG: serine/threonine protein kinase [Gammaproteobacteria bacterium]|nr:serine/threonine protein kinase [Gammaproteobacteria bacterium]
MIEIPGFRIESRIGEGGMATVYLAVQENLDREIALKVMNSALVSDHAFCERFLKEGKIIAKVSSHPDIVTIHDIGCYDGQHYYMAMEYVAGGNLKDRIKSRVSQERPLDILRHVASALGYAHELGFIHRDVKPANILFRENGEPVLSDFGIAKSLNSETQLTKIGFTVGTPEYMSPEQAVGQGMDGRSDIYSLGVVFYEMLTGEKPFKGDDAFSTALLHVNSQIPRLPGELERFQPLLDGMLAKKPNDRFADGEALIRGIEAIEAGRLPEGIAVTRAPASAATRAMPGLATGPKGARSDADEGGGLPGWVRGLAVAVAAIGLGLLAFLYYAGIPGSGGLPEERGGATPADVVSADPAPGGDTDSAEAGSQDLKGELRVKVDRLLGIAEAHETVGRLTEPPGANALEAYRMVLELDPANLRAQEAIARIESGAGS